MSFTRQDKILGTAEQSYKKAHTQQETFSKKKEILQILRKKLKKSEI